MKHWRPFALALMSTALAGVYAIPGQSAEEIQMVRQAPRAVTQAMPFTTYQQEINAAMQALSCKWISMDGRVGPSYGGGRYDFLCKGGDWATVSLYIDKGNGGGVGKVRLLFREWKDQMNPNAGEAFVAQKYLQHAVYRFVPAARAGEVMESFWRSDARTWEEGGVRIKYTLEQEPQYAVHRLEIAGDGKTLAPVVVPVPVKAVVTPTDAGLAKPVPVLPATLPNVSVPASAVVVAPINRPTAVIAPITSSVPAPIMPVFPAPAEPDAAAVLPVPGQAVAKPVSGGLVVPASAPAGPVEAPVVPSPTLPKASPAELNTAPAPESKVKPTPPPPTPANLVPNKDEVLMGRERAPSNFDAYNRAVELTKDVEKKAMISGGKAAPVAPKKAAAPTGAVVVPAPAPGVDENSATPAAALDGKAEGQSRTLRPLPQLQFVPKAEPLKEPGDEVIRFEDEGSRL